MLLSAEFNIHMHTTTRSSILSPSQPPIWRLIKVVSTPFKPPPRQWNWLVMHTTTWWQPKMTFQFSVEAPYLKIVPPLCIREHNHVDFECSLKKCKNVYLCKKSSLFMHETQNLKNWFVWINPIERNVALRTRKLFCLFVNGTLTQLEIDRKLCLLSFFRYLRSSIATILGNGELYLPLIK